MVTELIKRAFLKGLPYMAIVLCAIALIALARKVYSRDLYYSKASRRPPYAANEHYGLSNPRPSTVRHRMLGL